jgi:hypothetical protein
MRQYQVQKLHIIKREVKIIKNNMVRKLEEKVMFYIATSSRIHLNSTGKGSANINWHSIYLTLQKQTRKRIPI